MLKIPIAILFLFVFLSVNTELHQLLRFPVLIHHFLEHKDQKTDITFTDFLKDHYSEKQNHSDNKHKDHDNLPFKSTDCSIAHVSLAFVNQIQIFIPKPVKFFNRISPVYKSGYYSSNFVNTIWQPPKNS